MKSNQMKISMLTFAREVHETKFIRALKFDDGIQAVGGSSIFSLRYSAFKRYIATYSASDLSM